MGIHSIGLLIEVYHNLGYRRMRRIPTSMMIYAANVCNEGVEMQHPPAHHGYIVHIPEGTIHDSALVAYG